ncbi:MAG TPA: peptide ABC transporter substrate-binding protein [Gemmatimonadaceae bacterium]|nr:peptide ABC transporter substrate-binding protein [Gemmatimonadaceae bacterium]
MRRRSGRSTARLPARLPARQLRGAALLALGLAAACGPTARDPGTVVIASGADLESANPLVTVHPLSRQVQRHVLLVTLARYDSTLAPEPYLARRWEWSPDRRTLTLHLFGGLRWHDGRPTTARDAAFTIAAGRDPATGYPRAADLAAIEAARAVDDTTLVLRFARPQAAFPAVLCELPLVPAHLLRDVPRAEMRRAAFGTAPVGNGPFRFVSRRAGARWVFERNESFPPALGGPPRIHRLVVAVVDEATTKFAGLVSGELDAAGIAPTMADLVAEDPSLRVLTYPVLFSTAIVFNTARAPFDDVRVRRAVDLAVRRDRIVDAAFAGLALPAAGPVPPASPLYVPVQPRYDPHAADSLLDAAGWRRAPGERWRSRGGEPLAFELLTVGSGDNAAEQLIQADLAERGIRVEIRQREMGAFLDAARARPPRFDALIAGIPGDPSLAYLAAMYDSRAAGGALDYADFHTPTLDSLFARVSAAPDTAAVRRAWAAVQRELARELPAAWLYHSRGVQGLSARLHGVTMDLRGELATVARWSVAGSAAEPRATLASP